MRVPVCVLGRRGASPYLKLLFGGCYLKVTRCPPDSGPSIQEGSGVAGPDCRAERRGGNGLRQAPCVPAPRAASHPRDPVPSSHAPVTVAVSVIRWGNRGSDRLRASRSQSWHLGRQVHSSQAPGTQVPREGCSSPPLGTLPRTFLECPWRFCPVVHGTGSGFGWEERSEDGPGHAARCGIQALWPPITPPAPAYTCFLPDRCGRARVAVPDVSRQARATAKRNHGSHRSLGEKRNWVGVRQGRGWQGSPRKSRETAQKDLRPGPGGA